LALLALLTAAMLTASCEPEAASSSGDAPIAGTSSAAAESASVRMLDALPVLAVRQKVAGYQRGCSPGERCSFGPAWTDDTDAPGSHNGCDTRNDLLAQSMTRVQFRAESRCVVVAGELAEPYTGRTVQWLKADGGALQVDHIVPLAYAWDVGASEWSQDVRDTFANDLTLELLLVDGPANQSKGDSGPAEWMPSNKAYACTYVSRFVSVLSAYKLGIAEADRAASRRILLSCP
jgi:hypothetical protein